MHGIKSALANIGKMDLSAVALKLESAGRDAKFDILKSETPSFLDTLRTYTEELAALKKADTGNEATGDNDHLTESLSKIKSACEEYDENTAEALLSDLRKMNWSQNTSELLSAIAEDLLHSDFDEVVKAIDEFAG